MSGHVPMDDEYTIDALAQAAGLTTSTVRYYQHQGLLPPPRLDGRLGIYSKSHLDRLLSIRRMKERGYSLPAIRDFLELQSSDLSTEGLARLAAGESDAEQDIHTLLVEALGSSDALPIRQAIDLGVLRIDDGRLAVTEDQYRPLVVSIARLYMIGVPAAESVQVWAVVQQQVEAIAGAFAELAQKHVYGGGHEDPPLALKRLIQAATQVVRYALLAAISRDIGERLA